MDGTLIYLLKKMAAWVYLELAVSDEMLLTG